MTTIKIIKKNNRFKELRAYGHTGFGEYGSDILCASVSAIIQTAGLGINNLVTKKIILKCDEKKPEFKIIFPDNLLNEEYLQAELILKTCIEGLKNLASGYPKNLKVEDDDNVN